MQAPIYLKACFKLICWVAFDLEYQHWYPLDIMEKAIKLISAYSIHLLSQLHCQKKHEPCANAVQTILKHYEDSAT
jgi:hypothetical protein